MTSPANRSIRSFEPQVPLNKDHLPEPASSGVSKKVGRVAADLHHLPQVTTPKEHQAALRQAVARRKNEVATERATEQVITPFKQTVKETREAAITRLMADFTKLGHTKSETLRMEEAKANSELAATKVHAKRVQPEKLDGNEVQAPVECKKAVRESPKASNASIAEDLPAPKASPRLTHPTAARAAHPKGSRRPPTHVNRSHDSKKNPQVS